MTWTSRQRIYQDEAAWIEARRGFVGASETAAIFGCGYQGQNQLSVWAEKVHGTRHEADDDLVLKWEIGKLIEPAIAACFTLVTGLDAFDPGRYTVHHHAEIDWLAATLDRFAEHPEHGRVPVELKNVDSMLRRQWTGDADVPLKFSIQIQHQMAVTGATHGYLVGLVGGNQPHAKLVARNQRFIDLMLDRLTKFWALVESGTMPPIDSEYTTGQVLRAMWPIDNEQAIAMPDELAKWDQQRMDAIAAQKSAETRRNEAENHLKTYLGENQRGEFPNGVAYSWKTQIEHHSPRPAREIVKRVMRRHEPKGKR